MSDKGKIREAAFQSVLQNCKSILVKNVVPCQELFDKLSELNVFGDSMIQEIKVWFHFILYYCKTITFPKHLIFAQNRESVKIKCSGICSRAGGQTCPTSTDHNSLNTSNGPIQIIEKNG